jgi:hypothetical protein
MTSPHRHNDTHTTDNRAALRDLHWAIREHQRAKRAGEAFEPPMDMGGRRANTSLVLATCECSREVRMAPGVLADGVIVCGICSTPFRPVRR